MGRNPVLIVEDGDVDVTCVPVLLCIFQRAATVLLYHPCAPLHERLLLSVLARSCLPHYIITPHPQLNNHTVRRTPLSLFSDPLKAAGDIRLIISLLHLKAVYSVHFDDISLLALTPEHK